VRRRGCANACGLQVSEEHLGVVTCMNRDLRLEVSSLHAEHSVPPALASA
jgi:hypothetical protein